ncbi:E3 ubiquitin-protein ligase MIB2-like isoform X1 [Dreissena polymorpha]|uniref:RING-type E3 ubiquitin transferase n=1 Tax=Dreissena polymorpha TaxID=45954 RepID=A0A9D4IR67_DREPO|nr:E3 ubiquitin-protein ligase MIB2-like isoform X1 [Dreissena polymorpha]KAH3783590.1 hypothetical protein DPMN_161532 [Dreissena polymorpha]
MEGHIEDLRRVSPDVCSGQEDGCEGQVGTKTVPDDVSEKTATESIAVSHTTEQPPQVSAHALDSNYCHIKSERILEKTNLETSDHRLHVGDIVCVDVSDSTLKKLQYGHGGYNEEMSRYIGRSGKLLHIEQNDDLIIDYGGVNFRINQEAARKVPQLKFGDKVKILTEEHKAQILQAAHGGWSSEYTETLGKVGKVVNIDSDGDVTVEIGDTAFVFNAACCDLMKVPSGDTNDTANSTSNKTNIHTSNTTGGNSDSESNECISCGGEINGSVTEGQTAEAFAESVRGMHNLLQALNGVASLAQNTQQRQSLSTPSIELMGPKLVVQASACNDIPMVLFVLQNNPIVINAKHQGLTALIVASHEGNKAVVEILIAAGADLNITDDNGNTALMAATLRNHEDIAMILIRAGSNIHFRNKKGQGILHFAAIGQANGILKEALMKGVDPNTKERDRRDTPLHTAIMTNNIAGALCLIQHLHVDIEVSDAIGHNALTLAAMKECVTLVEALVDRLPSLANYQKSEDGYTALHVAAINDAVGVIAALIKRNANANIPGNDHTIPLHLSCNEGYIKSSKLLIKAGANANAQDNSGNTPLHHCVSQWRKRDIAMSSIECGGMDKRTKEIWERTELGCLLIRNGASVNVANRAGNLPLQLCLDVHMRDILQTCSEIRVLRETKVGQNIYNIVRKQLPENLFLQVLCKTPILCFKCLNEMADTALAPCGHLTTCRSCSMRLHVCPVCSVRIKERTLK